ncbi:MAG: hypothetical protein JRE40_15220, partial [Deltaproteobacteria bacterium]|nr:hypothetical protein [Deltaproteobacteria bacterium]
NIYAQRLNASGNELWATDGIPLTTMAEDQAGIVIIPDGSGGAFIAWIHNPNWTSGNIYVQQVNASGTVLWTTAVQTGTQAAQALDGEPGIISDGAGGVIVVWEWDRVSDTQQDKVFAQRIDGSGSRLWGLYGLTAANITDSYRDPCICSDNAGGAIIAWQQDGTGPDAPAIFAQRMNSAGDHQWTGSGTQVSSWELFDNDPMIVTATNNGAIILWNDQPYDNGNEYAQRLDGSGNALWQADGISVSDRTGSPGPNSLMYSSGGFIVTWSHLQSGSDVYAQRVSINGSRLWTDSGLTICAAQGTQRYPVLITDGSGGAIITWEDSRAGNNDIFTQYVDQSGNVLWPIDGIPVCTDLNTQASPSISYAGPNDGVIIAWEDRRNGLHDIYAQRIYDGLCEVEPAELDFGVIEVGSTKDSTFTLSNTGESILSGSVVESCDHYSIVGGGGPYSLAIGESLVIIVRFEPTTHGTHSCTVETGDDFCYDVVCTGVGAACPPGNVYYVDADAAGSADGSSWSDAFTELRDGLVASTVCSGVTEIWVAEGTYTPTGGTDRSATFQLQSGLALYGGFIGSETMLTERDWMANPTILSGDIGVEADSIDNSYHVVNGSSTDITAILDGFIVTKGVADGGAIDKFRGGGIYIKSGSPILINVTISGNSSRSEGLRQI